MKLIVSTSADPTSSSAGTLNAFQVIYIVQGAQNVLTEVMRKTAVSNQM